MTTAVREEWRADCKDCQYRDGPWEFKAPAVASRALHEVTHPAHRATVFVRLAI